MQTSLTRWATALVVVFSLTALNTGCTTSSWSNVPGLSWFSSQPAKKSTFTTAPKPSSYAQGSQFGPTSPTRPGGYQTQPASYATGAGPVGGRVQPQSGLYGGAASRTADTRNLYGGATAGARPTYQTGAAGRPTPGYQMPAAGSRGYNPPAAGGSNFRPAAPAATSNNYSTSPRGASAGYQPAATTAGGAGSYPPARSGGSYTPPATTPSRGYISSGTATGYNPPASKAGSYNTTSTPGGYQSTSTGGGYNPSSSFTPGSTNYTGSNTGSQYIR